MSHRRFVDRSGQRWEVRVRGRGDWEFRPERGNPSRPRRAEPPHWATDPFELSEQELCAIMGDAEPQERRGGAPSPFRDDDGQVGGGGDSLFSDYTPPAKPKSPFKDDR
ncbi:MAG: hypothetical protein R3195_04620 [Gemmatimonadota bacterium]|nr:hypothetical protein [Gemmatimonadota bacterium]